jgi:hypothetical protein
VLLALVPAEPDENRRSSLIEALGRSRRVRRGARPQPALSPPETRNCRWVTLKAMDYIGGADAEALVKSAGVDDKGRRPRGWRRSSRREE